MDRPLETQDDVAVGASWRDSGPKPGSEGEPTAPRAPVSDRLFSTLVPFSERLLKEVRSADAVALWKEQLVMMKEQRGERHSATFACLIHLAATLRRTGDYDSAQETGEKAAKLARELLGPEHPQTLACLFYLAVTHEHRGDYGAAAQLHEDVLSTREQTLGEDDPRIINSRIHLAKSYQGLSRYGEATRLAESALEASGRLFSHEDRRIVDPIRLHAKSVLGNLYLGQDRLDEAKPPPVEVLERREQDLGEQHVETLVARSNLGALYLHEGDCQAAEQSYNSVLPIAGRTLASPTT